MSASSADPGPQGAPASPLDAVPDIRSSAKWTLAALAAVGAALLGGVPLTALQQAHSVGRLVGTFAGLVIALCGIGWAIWHTSEVLMPRLILYRSLREPRFAEIREAVQAEPELFLGVVDEAPGADPLECFDRERRTSRRGLENCRRKLAEENDEIKRANWERAMAFLSREVAAHFRRTSHIIELMYAWDVWASARRARVHMFAGAGATLVGVLVFTLFSTGPSTGGQSAPAPSPGPASATPH